jgi:SAM-dependent methyltransferase
MQQTSLQMLPSETYKRNRYRSTDQSWVNRHEQHLMAKLLTLYDLSGATALDVPCGYGRFFPLYQHVGITVIGVDASLHMAQLTRRDSPGLDPQQVLHGNILHLPFADETFDIAICVRLLHHQFH